MEPRSNIEHALALAIQWHQGQLREGPHPLPYVTHAFEVVANLREIGGVTHESLWIVAALHDVVEHGSGTFPEIQTHFGDQVATLVKELTRQEPTTAEILGLTKDEIWKLRADRLIIEIANMSDDAQTVKLADRLANLRDALRTKSGKKLDRYRWQTNRILETIPKKRNQDLWDFIDKTLKSG
jgi:(p)ppGpp synthase/HD superfamily hydrolase